MFGSNPMNGIDALNCQLSTVDCQLKTIFAATTAAAALLPRLQQF